SAPRGCVVRAVAFSPDSTLLAYGEEVEGASPRDKYPVAVHLWDLKTERDKHKLEGHINGIMSLVFSPDGKTLVSTGGDQTVRFWDVAKGETVHTIDQYGSPLAFAPDGKLVAGYAGDSGTLFLWDPATSKEVRSIKDIGIGAQALAFSPDSKLLAT